MGGLTMINTEKRGVRPEKEAIVREISARVGEAGFMFFVDFNGVRVSMVNALRSSLREFDAEFHVAKNRLILHAMSGAEYTQDLSALLRNPTGMVTGSGDAVAVAKALKKFNKEYGMMGMKAGIFEERLLSAADVAHLADLPGKEELQGMLVGTLAAPLRQIAGVLQQKNSSIVYVLNAYINKKNEAA